MRTLPRSTRVAIATIYIRYRDARRREARARLSLGMGSPGTLKATGETLEAWNALCAISAAVAHDLRFPSPAAMVDLVTRRGHAFARAA